MSQKEDLLIDRPVRELDEAQLRVLHHFHAEKRRRLTAQATILRGEIESSARIETLTASELADRFKTDPMGRILGRRLL